MFWLNNVAKFSTALRRISTERWFDNQKECIFPISCVYLRSIQYWNFLHSIVLDVQLQDSDSIYMLLQRKCTPTLRKTKTDISLIHDLLKNPKLFPLCAHALFAARMTHHQSNKMFQPKHTRTISLDNSLPNCFRPLLILYITPAVRNLNILATSLSLPCYA